MCARPILKSWRTSHIGMDALSAGSDLTLSCDTGVGSCTCGPPLKRMHAVVFVHELPGTAASRMTEAPCECTRTQEPCGGATPRFPEATDTVWQTGSA